MPGHVHNIYIYEYINSLWLLLLALLIILNYKRSNNCLSSAGELFVFIARSIRDDVTTAGIKYVQL